MNRPAVEAFDPLAIIQVLREHQVRFVVIGGIAAGVQGAIWATTDLDIAYARDRENHENLAAGVQGAIWATTDLDIAYARDRENHENLAAALADLDSEPIDLAPGAQVTLDARSLAAGTNWTLQTRFGRLDLLGEPGGRQDVPPLRPSRYLTDYTNLS